ncbi:hypothetical protein A2767_06490 [Candidatus Roizmanbacteria bacterium RIFCSPHIGHO2_01_FULL_35_10]|uniref:Uncharacterized protein n=1 Tax=Candidatus Roizmanbacteria bacterium RIFCSPLOWO2_01_FULL_35_13 TaxID=1802055 RepID=A0A1F7IGX8_9BACT|nr:MAG: hypothetical protein A2767_06490 [Candidatus Roizmanbacteria bacterium RIFCSPHIGHO2_01_FULL_35_10]OGK42610.1 MAG: hypothetical protein A3A74_06265 [Candidatus Roizmanbacteria bacterium RIFCSPLOWO2_01_FULL_35_13]
MTIITIPHELVKEKELVLIPRKKFDELIRLAKGKISKVINSSKKINYDLIALKKLEKEALGEYQKGETKSISNSQELGLYYEQIRKDALRYGKNRN